MWNLHLVFTAVFSTQCSLIMFILKNKTPLSFMFSLFLHVLLVYNKISCYYELPYRHLVYHSLLKCILILQILSRKCFFCLQSL